jgi:hypothetical protein
MESLMSADRGVGNGALAPLPTFLLEDRGTLCFAVPYGSLHVIACAAKQSSDGTTQHEAWIASSLTLLAMTDV